MTPNPINMNSETLFNAIRSGDGAQINQILEEQPQLVDAVDQRGSSPLLLASYYGHRDLCEILIARGAKINAKDASGNTALMGVCFKGYTDVAQLLVEKGADVNIQNFFDWVKGAKLVELDTCDTSIAYYEIFYQNELSDEFTLVGTTTDTVFVHENLPEYKGCYKIRAVDRSENRSVFSNTFCKENCPNLAFPNVITPGNSPGKNDVFTPFYPGASESAIPLEFCPRFLEQIEFNVYNRYGKLVYSYRSGGENSLYINWTGVNNNGEELPSHQNSS